jgi:predicted DCC family thiol-disulfide oxidoreductase YuxK
MERAIVLYDEDCGFCRWSADRLRVWDRPGRLAFAPIEGVVGARTLARVDPPARTASWHLITEDGRVWSAGAAIPQVLRRLPAGAVVAPLFETFPGTTERAYGWFARHRIRLGAALGQQACAVDPSRPKEDRRGARPNA